VFVTCVKIPIRMFVCEALCVVWLLVCVLTVVSAMCSFLLYSSLRDSFLNVSYRSNVGLYFVIIMLYEMLDEQ
jgi:uncharacterized membrane protein